MGKIWRNTKIILLLAIPVTLLVLPTDFFDQGKSISLFSLLGAGEHAYSTGMTRSIMHLIHLDVSGAAAYNKLGFVVLPLLFLLWLKALLREFNTPIMKWF